MTVLPTHSEEVTLNLHVACREGSARKNEGSWKCEEEIEEAGYLLTEGFGPDWNIMVW